jgi:hypothetical protein
MATKQTRRSISVRGATYETLRRYCESKNRSMSEIVEEQLARLIGGSGGNVGRPAPTPAETVIADRVRAPKGDYRAIRF